MLINPLRQTSICAIASACMYESHTSCTCVRNVCMSLRVRLEPPVHVRGGWFVCAILAKLHAQQTATGSQACVIMLVLLVVCVACTLGANTLSKSERESVLYLFDLMEGIHAVVTADCLFVWALQRPSKNITSSSRLPNRHQHYNYNYTQDARHHLHHKRLRLRD